jgi:hypothetical protein
MISLNGANKKIEDLREAQKAKDRDFFQQSNVLRTIWDITEERDACLTPEKFLGMTNLTTFRLEGMSDQELKDYLADWYNANQNNDRIITKWGDAGGCVLMVAHRIWLGKLGKRYDANFSLDEKIALLRTDLKLVDARLSGTEPVYTPPEAELRSHFKELFPEFEEPDPDQPKEYWKRSRRFVLDCLAFLQLKQIREPLPREDNIKMIRFRWLYNWGENWDGSGFPDFWFDPDDPADREAVKDYLADAEARISAEIERKWGDQCQH